ncbi:MAG: biotin--[acetyl-CoA-carboxylase] ligase [Peptococcaceae bacterium]|nr:biotin--[acetyl-CoA-carboxylase] ligase [Peptococcaceae bacterium]
MIDWKIHCLDTIDSTNNECRRRAAENEGTVILSEEQTAGRGRQGRAWNSPKGKGVWMSLLLKPDLPTETIPQLTLVGAAAVCKAMEKEEGYFPDKIKIKWPNDIFIREKKAGGILTEMQISAGRIESVIQGIGLNVNLAAEDFPDELKALATSFLIETGKVYERERIIADILNHFEILYEKFLVGGELGEALHICRQNSAVIGRQVRLMNNGTETEAEVLDLGPRGELIVKLGNGRITSVISGEISLRIQS